MVVRNVDGTNNSTGAITYWVEVNMYYKGHVERIKMEVCNLGRTEVILGMPWLQAHNPEINWETGEVKMTRYPLLCEGNKGKEKKRARKGKRVVTLEEEKIVRWTLDNKKDWGREEYYKSPKKKIVSHTFGYLIHNIKIYKRVKI